MASETAAYRGRGRASRRSVLRSIGIGGATALVAGIGLSSHRAAVNGVLDAGTGAAYDPWDLWRDAPGSEGLVAAAILAANPHNTQPWRFTVTAESIELRADLARRTPSIDPFNRELQIGLGCALENLVLGARARGYECTVDPVPDPADPELAARVTLARGRPRTSPLYAAIGDRHTDRGPYRDDPVPRTRLAALADHGADLPGAAVYWIIEPDAKNAFGDLLIAGTEAVVADEEQSVEGFAWFRAGRADIDRHRDGLTLDAQGLDPVTLAAAKLLPAASRASGDAFWVERTRSIQTATAAAYGVLTVTDPHDPVQRIVGGRLLQRLHLAAVADGLAVQHMNQITERIDRETSLGVTSAFEPRLASLLPDREHHALAAFRIGFPTRPARRSPRRPVSEVTT